MTQSAQKHFSTTEGRGKKILILVAVIATKNKKQKTKI